MTTEFKWAVGVTTVPSRRRDLLPRTLNSLCDAGFGDCRLFVDDCDDPASYREFDRPVTTRYPRIRTHGNWFLALHELYIREPHAHYFAMFQDDLVAYRNLRDYLERCTYPERGYWNLYTFPENQQRARSIGWFESNQKGKGAVALVFNNQCAEILMGHYKMIGRPKNAQRGWRAVDGGVVNSLSAAEGWREYCHNPSLVQHTGVHSSMGNGRHPLAPSFRGEQFDAMELLKETA